MDKINTRRIEQQIRNCQKILTAYDYKEPFSRFLTQFFKQNKQMGSSDRRMASRLCYNFFRLGNAFKNLELVERLTIAEFLCEQQSDVVGLYQPSWLFKELRTVEEKVAFLTNRYDSIFLENVFPHTKELSSSVDKRNFVISHFLQPDLFIRVVRGKESFVEKHLSNAGIVFRREIDQVYRLPNGSKLQDIGEIEGLIQVQDFSSQQSLNNAQVKAGESWWDACAASGGKSLLLIDRQPDINLLVSDLRLSILRNLDERFHKSYTKISYRKKVIDLTGNFANVMEGESFDGVILDAPCSGSGTWGRTPEMSKHFLQESIIEFSRLQKQIAANVATYVKSGGQLIYITCSVFAKENEEVTKYIAENYGFTIEEGGIIAGYQRRSDSMYAARLRKY